MCHIILHTEQHEQSGMETFLFLFLILTMFMNHTCQCLDMLRWSPDFISRSGSCLQTACPDESGLASPLTKQQQSNSRPTHISRPFWQSIGQSSFWATPLCKDGWVSCWGLVCIKLDTQPHEVNTFTHGHVESKRNSVLLVLFETQLSNRHLSESEMATFVSVSFPSHQHSGLSTARLRLADPCRGGLFWPVLTLCNSGCLVSLMGVTEGLEECWRRVVNRYPLSLLVFFPTGRKVFCGHKK